MSERNMYVQEEKAMRNAKIQPDCTDNDNADGIKLLTTKFEMMVLASIQD